jgi:hypothetical protein
MVQKPKISQRRFKGDSRFDYRVSTKMATSDPDKQVQKDLATMLSAGYYADS